MVEFSLELAGRVETHSTVDDFRWRDVDQVHPKPALHWLFRNHRFELPFPVAECLCYRCLAREYLALHLTASELVGAQSVTQLSRDYHCLGLLVSARRLTWQGIFLWRSGGLITQLVRSPGKSRTLSWRLGPTECRSKRFVYAVKKSTTETSPVIMALSHNIRWYSLTNSFKSFSCCYRKQYINNRSENCNEHPHKIRRDLLSCFYD